MSLNVFETQTYLPVKGTVAYLFIKYNIQHVQCVSRDRLLLFYRKFFVIAVSFAPVYSFFLFQGR